MANNPGVNRLARTLTERMRVQSEAPPAIEFGKLGKGCALSTDTFRIPIPKQDYQADQRLLSGEGKLQEGDRVLVLWVGNTPVVLGTVASAKGL